MRQIRDATTLNRAKLAGFFPIEPAIFCSKRFTYLPKQNPVKAQSEVEKVKTFARRLAGHQRSARGVLQPSGQKEGSGLQIGSHPAHNGAKVEGVMDQVCFFQRIT